MASSKGDCKPIKESPRVQKKGGDAEAKEQPLKIKGKKGSKEVDSKKDGKTVQDKKLPGNDGKQNELGSLEEETLVEKSKVEPEEAKESTIQHQLCASCDEVHRRWPPPPYVDPNPRDPTLLYPSDEDPDFQPSRGDILIIHPGLHMGLMDLHRQLPKDGFVSSYDGLPTFEFALGDLVLRVGTFDDISITAEKTKQQPSKLAKGGNGSPRKGEEQNKKSQPKAKKDDDKKASSQKTKPKKGMGKLGEEGNEVIEKPQCNYNPFEKLELYTCSGFITVEEQAKLDADKLAIEAEKERLENEAKKKGAKGKTEKKIKENVGKDGKKKPQEVDGKATGSKRSKDGKLEAQNGIQEGSLVSVDAMESRQKPKWRYLGSQMRLDIKSQNLIGKQCPGLTYFYRRYTRAGSRCDMHSLTPLLGEILINVGWLNNWYRNLEKWQKEENQYKSLVKWSRPGFPDRAELIPGMILLRPLVGREHDKWVGWGLDGKKLPLPLLPQPLIPKEDDKILDVQAEEVIAPLPKCDCHRKSPCPKPPCPCHLYDPCPKLPNCGCIYCNPLPRKPKPPPPEEQTPAEEKNTKDKRQKKEKGGKNVKDEKSSKEPKKAKDANDVKQNDSKMKSNDAKIQTKTSKQKGKDGQETKLKGEGTKDDLKGETDVPIKPYVWGAVEMYLFYGEEDGWEFWGRSDRICDTPYPLQSENAKPKFLHADDCLKVDDIMDDKSGLEKDSLAGIVKDSVVENPTINKNTKTFETMLVNKKLQNKESAQKNKQKT